MPDPAPAAFPVPPYLPPAARTVVPWARQYAATTARRASLSRDDTWDEALAALLRAAVYFRPGAGTFAHYCRTSIVRGLWRYATRAAVRQARHGTHVPLEEASVLPALTVASAEEIVLACELAASRARTLTQHATLAASRGDAATADILRAAAHLAKTTAAHGRPTRRA